MRAHAHHPHGQSHLPLRFFALEHPYAAEWALVTAVALAALLLWYANS